MLVLLAALGPAATGCGSSNQEAASGHATTATQKPPRSAAAGGNDRPSASSGSRSEQRAGQERAQRRSAGQPAAGEGSSGAGSHPPTQVNPDSGSVTATARGLCPPPLTRADCAARIREQQQQANDTPSYPVSTPSDCLKAMSEAECKEIFSAQKAAVEAGGGRSIDPQTCLQEYSREFCEAQLGDQYEQQQRAASQAAQ